MAGTPTFSESLRIFRELPAPTRHAVVDQFEQSGPCVSLDDLVAPIASKLGLESSPLIGLLRGIGSVVPLTATDEKFRELMLSWILSQGGAQTEQGAAIEQSDFRSCVDRLLRCENSIGLSAKSQAIMWGHGKVYKEAHIITQIRPIFFHEISQEPATAVIIHEIRIDYRENEQPSSFCVNLDRSQLRALRGVVKRALGKERSLRAAMKFNYLVPRFDGASDE